MTRALHLPAHDESAELGRSLCGRSAVWLSSDKATCKQCAKLQGSRHDFTRPVSWEEAFTDLGNLLAPRITPSPPVTPDSWRRMRCRHGEAMTPAQWDMAARDGNKHPHYRICQCDFCDHDMREAKVRAEHEQSQQVRPHRKHAFPFGSYRAALLHALHRPSVLRSSAGSAQARAEETAKLGTAVQTTVRERDPNVRVDLALDVRRCIERAFADEQSRRSYELHHCVTAMLDLVRDPPLYTDEYDAIHSVRAIQRHGRKHVQIELAIAELTPWPRAPRLVTEIQRRLWVQRYERRSA
jgi:hypothetical protein